MIFPWDVFFALRLTRARHELAERLPAWLERFAEFEALSALATFAYLNPAATYPQVGPADAPGVPDGPILNGVQIGHPLIPGGARVCNDFALERVGQIAIITGSNMSGKSSLLRALGVNLALAYAGGPVVAEGLRARACRLFACIRVADSVTDGFSYFYAEVRRLRALLDALNAPDAAPLIYLIDEIFRGTNNRERLIGSRAYIRALAGGHGAGVVSTHDLELVRLADELPDAHNLHFREDVIDGRMAFDYLLRPGPSPTTNALRIMALEGLPVGEGAAQEVR
jgi:DNA mismatch repair ATPase MutS